MNWGLIVISGKQEEGSSPRRRSWLGLVSLSISLIALVVSLGDVVYLNFHVFSFLVELEKLRVLTNVPKMHNTIEEQPAKNGLTRDYRLRLINLDTRPVENTRVVVEVYQNNITVLPPLANVAVSPPYKAAVSGGAAQIVISFDEDIPKGQQVEIIIKGFSVNKNYMLHSQIKTWVYTKQGESKIAYNRVNPK